MDLPGAWLLLAPAGLFGLLALAIPVLIHLISHGRGRRVLTGNIELLRAARQARVTTPRLTQWLLLLLRMTIVIVATLLLARSALQGIDSADADVAYVTPGWLRSANDAERAERLSREPVSRVLAPGYPQAREYEPAVPDPDYDVWPLLAERLSALRHTGTVDVYAESSIAAFGTHRPRLPNEISWHLATAAAGLETLESRGLVIHDRGRADDVNRLELALAALKGHRVPQLQWETCLTGDMTCRSQPRDWIVWLADAEPPEGIDSARLYWPQDPAWRLATSDPRYPEILLDEILGAAQQRRAWQLSAPVARTPAGRAVGRRTPVERKEARHRWLMRACTAPTGHCSGACACGAA